MCDVLQIARSTYYYEAKIRDDQEEELTDLIVDILNKVEIIMDIDQSRTEKERLDCIRRRTGRIMKEQGLVSKYTVAQFKPSQSSCNESKAGNTLNREFEQDQELKVVVSDLTYVRVGQNWHYIFVLVDLYNREIIGHSAGPHKSAALVQRAFCLRPIQSPSS